MKGGDKGDEKQGLEIRKGLKKTSSHGVSLLHRS